MASGNSLILSLKIVLMTTGALFIALLLCLSLPEFLSATASGLPVLRSTFRAWLRPPYLYVIINCIIITIAASSRFHHYFAAAPKAAPPHQHDVIAVRADQYHPHGDVYCELIGSYYAAVSVKDVDVDVVESIVEEVKAPPPVMDCEIPVAEIGGGREECGVDDRTPPSETQELSSEVSSERLPASSRFGHRRRPIKATPAEGGKAVRIAKPKRHHETLESTWKAITEGRQVPLTRHLKSSSDTWENLGRQIDLLDSSPPPAVKKCETFKDRTNYSPPPVFSTLKKAPSLSQDELNRRVEEFINKFNEEMRLQRQQSIQQFQEMINRAT